MAAFGDRTLDILEEAEPASMAPGSSSPPVGSTAFSRPSFQANSCSRSAGGSPNGEEHLQRIRHHEVGDGIESTSADDAVDDRPDLPAQRRFERRQAPGREERVEQPTVAHVVGRIDRDRHERRGLPNESKARFDENTSGWRPPSSTAAHDVRNTAPSISTTSPASRTMRHRGAVLADRYVGEVKGTGRYLSDLARLFGLRGACVLRHRAPSDQVFHRDLTVPSTLPSLLTVTSATVVVPSMAQQMFDLVVHTPRGC